MGICGTAFVLLNGLTRNVLTMTIISSNSETIPLYDLLYSKSVDSGSSFTSAMIEPWYHSHSASDIGDEKW